MSCPLDGFAPPDRAYGLHQILSSWGGNLASITDANGATEHVLTPDSDKWTTLSEIEALASGFSGGNAYWHTLYDETGNGAHATSLAENSGGRPPMAAAGGVAYRMTLAGVERPCVFRRPLAACRMLMGGGNYALHTSRFFIHAVIEQLAVDSSNTSQLPPASTLIGQDWNGTPTIRDNVQILGYGGGSGGTTGVNYAVMNDIGTAWDNLTAAWAQDAVHIVSARRDGNTSLQCFTDGALQEALTIANTTAAATACALFNSAGTTGHINDGFRCTEIAHWQSDPGNIQADLYAATLAAFGPSNGSPTSQFQVSLKPRLKLPPVRQGFDHLPAAARRWVTGNPKR